MCLLNFFFLQTKMLKPVTQSEKKHVLGTKKQIYSRLFWRSIQNKIIFSFTDGAKKTSSSVLHFLTDAYNNNDSFSLLWSPDGRHRNHFFAPSPPLFEEWPQWSLSHNLRSVGVCICVCGGKNSTNRNVAHCSSKLVGFLKTFIDEGSNTILRNGSDVNYM